MPSVSGADPTSDRMTSEGLRHERVSRDLVQRSFQLDAESMGRKVAVGAGFKFLGIGFRTLMTLGSTAVLARLLVPADFGYVAMATVVTEFAALFGAFGFASVLIQRKRITRLQLDTVFWATGAIGAALALLVFALSFTTTWLFADPAVGPLLRVLCLAFVLNSLTAIPGVVLARLMRFRTEFWIDAGALLLRSSSAIVAAVGGIGMWSLVIGALAGAAGTLVLSYVCVPYRPRWRFDLKLLIGTWRTSGSYLGNGTLHYVNSNLDLLLVGRSLGATALGYYQNARSLTDEIRARIANPIQQVLFPAFSALQSDRAQSQAMVLRAARLLAAVVMPAGLGVSANATELVLLLYGEQWRPMIPVVAILGAAAALRASTAIASPLFNANDRVALGLRYNILYTLTLICGIWAALPHGMVAVAWAVSASTLVALVTFYAALCLIGLGARSIVETLGPPAVASAVMWAVTVVSRGAGWSDHPAALLAGHVLLGAITYLAVVATISRALVQDVRIAYAALSGGRSGRTA